MQTYSSAAWQHSMPVRRINRNWRRLEIRRPERCDRTWCRAIPYKVGVAITLLLGLTCDRFKVSYASAKAQKSVVITILGSGNRGKIHRSK